MYRKRNERITKYVKLKDKRQFKRKKEDFRV
jgi:hypothetical protein